MKFVNCDKKIFLKKITDKTKIICFGGKRMAREAIEELGIEAYVEFIVDNDKNLKGKNTSVGNKKFPILDSTALEREGLDEYIILITSASVFEIQKQLQLNENLKNLECYSYPLMKYNMEIDSEEFFQKRILSSCMEHYGEILGYQNLKTEQVNELLDRKRKYINGEFTNGIRPVVISQVNYYLTSRCNLSCKRCSALVPYFNGCHEDVPIEQVLSDFKLFISAVDECISVELLGGETFLYKQLNEVLEYLINERKVISIIIPTNSLVMPKHETLQLLSNDKVFIRVSDYGHIDKISTLVSVLEQNNIKFNVLTEREWDDTGDINYRGKDKEMLKYEFMHCDISRYVKVLLNGKLHVCERSARMFQLEKFTSEHDYVDLSEIDSVNELREKILSIYYSDYADICNYCDRGKFPVKKIRGGEQEDGRIDISNYTIVRREEYDKMKEMLRDFELYYKREE